MPTVEENKTAWGGSYSWSQSGDEWSDDWGGPSMQWYGSILPRIHAFVPTGSILEIACGYGRWTHFLKDLCQRLTAVDLAERCIDACRARFAGSTHIKYVVNDGRSLAMIPEASVDFVFSFDSLVHADPSVLQAYLAELARILTKNGAAFIHHSNLGEYPRYRRLEKLPRLYRLLGRLRLVDEVRPHWRDFNVTGAHVVGWARERGLCCINQELVNWRTRRTLMDCMSTIVRADSVHARELRVVRNVDFASEMRCLRRLADLYRPLTPPAQLTRPGVERTHA
ncbi:MAG: class I SAM-dependent methyltransferase [Candidatus Methylomirabilota bacterium]